MTQIGMEMNCARKGGVLATKAVNHIHTRPRQCNTHTHTHEAKAHKATGGTHLVADRRDQIVTEGEDQIRDAPPGRRSRGHAASQNSTRPSSIFCSGFPLDRMGSAPTRMEVRPPGEGCAPLVDLVDEDELGERECGREQDG